MANLNCLTHDTANEKEHTYRINECDSYFIYKEDVYPLSKVPAIYPNSADIKTLPDPIRSVFDLRFEDIDEAKCFFEAFDYFPREFEYMLYLDGCRTDDHHMNDNFSNKVLNLTGEPAECIALVKDRKTGKYAALPGDSTVVYGDDDDHDEVTNMKVDTTTRYSVCDGVIAYKTEDHAHTILEGYEYDQITKDYTDVKTIRHIADPNAITRISDYHYSSTGDLTAMLLYIMQCAQDEKSSDVITFEKIENINGVSAGHINEQMDLVLYKTKEISYALYVFRNVPNDDSVTLVEGYVFENLKDIYKMFR